MTLWWALLGCPSDDLPTGGSPEVEADTDTDGDVDSDSDGDTDTSAPTTATTGDTGPLVPPGRDYSADPALFFGTSRCAEAGTLLCDGFEGSALDPSWTPEGPVPVIDPTRAARGGSSLHVHADGNGRSYVKHTAIFPVADNAYWGRVFVWFDALPTAPDWAHWTIVGATGPDVPGEIRVGGQLDPFFGANRYGVGTDGGATGDWTNLDDDGGPVAPAEDRWVCVEWHHDATADTTAFYVDAVEHPSLATTAADHGGYLLPAFDAVWIGWWLYQGGSAPDHFDVWMDEVALDTERIGCVL